MQTWSCDGPMRTGWTPSRLATTSPGESPNFPEPGFSGQRPPPKAPNARAYGHCARPRTMGRSCSIRRLQRWDRSAVSQSSKVKPVTEQGIRSRIALVQVIEQGGANIIDGMNVDPGLSVGQTLAPSPRRGVLPYRDGRKGITAVSRKRHWRTLRFQSCARATSVAPRPALRACGEVFCG